MPHEIHQGTPVELTGPRGTPSTADSDPCGPALSCRSLPSSDSGGVGGAEILGGWKGVGFGDSPISSAKRSNLSRHSETSWLESGSSSRKMPPRGPAWTSDEDLLLETMMKRCDSLGAVGTIHLEGPTGIANCPIAVLFRVIG